ncbi:hypothetical protein Y032_0043g799 [Ancylostoma ceylanicum]|uniref:Uncharacterized protein n=1 Tax=Ancylostoma ceylanicum TaxID=53326 RepID=A0A016UEM6_9BILA|nr:hypothetical protein Y032_0043g799 [Ancylostoma ceylanicum]
MVVLILEVVTSQLVPLRINFNDCYFRDPVRLARPKSTLDQLLEFPTATRSPTFVQRAASSSVPVDEEHLVDTKLKLFCCSFLLQITLLAFVLSVGNKILFIDYVSEIVLTQTFC